MFCLFLTKNPIISDTKKSKNKSKKSKKNKQTNESLSQQNTNENKTISEELTKTEESISGSSVVSDGAIGGQTQTADSEELNTWTYNKLQDIKKAVEMLNLYQGGGPAKTPEDAMKKRYDFWETQPVPKLDETPNENTAIEPNKSKDDIRKDSLNLPQAFIWDTLDVNDESIVSFDYILDFNFINH
jgi:glycylpeptide N-tetradecanoyltransferase